MHSNGKSNRTMHLPDTPVNAAELHISAGVLYDVVVLASASDGRMTPLCDDIPKAMLPICGRPLIWHCLRHWTDNGVRQFFLCLPEYDHVAVVTYLKDAFPEINFHVVLVKPNLENGNQTNGCHALAAYKEFKKTELRGTQAGLTRDVLLVNCDTILTKVDLQPFITNFYASFATAAVLLWRVGAREAAAADAASTTKGGGKKNNQQHLELKKYQEELCSVIAEPDEVVQLAPFASSSSNMGKQQQQQPGTFFGSPAASSGVPLVEHMRLHYLAHSSDEARVSVGFAARRPNLTCFADASDAGVYLLRPFAVDYIIAESKEDSSLQLDVDLIPMLARSQHALINEERKTFMKPEEKLNVDGTIGSTLHWALDTHESVDSSSSSLLKSLATLNAVQPLHASSAALCDTLKVVCSIINEKIEAPASAPRVTFPPSIRRVSSSDAYIAVCQEVLATFMHTSQLVATDGHSLYTAQLCFACNPSLFRYSSTGVATLDEIVVEHLKAQPSNRVVESIVFSPTHETSFIKRSIIGKGVVIGKNCHVTNSIILDNVELGEGTTISNAVIAGGAEVQRKQTVSMTIVAPRTIVSAD